VVRDMTGEWICPRRLWMHLPKPSVIIKRKDTTFWASHSHNRYSGSGCQRRGNSGEHGHQSDSPLCTIRTWVVDGSGIMGNSVPSNHRANPLGPGMGRSARKGSLRTHPGKSWRSKPTRRRGRGGCLQLVQDLQWEEHRSGSATPAVQRGSVPRRLFFAAQQRIAITWKPN
jgi:hypothetical protein